jgi:hypothetical protein
MNDSKKLLGRRFGRLVVESLSNKVDKANNLFWNCICDCGNKKEISGHNLFCGRTISCGCYRNEKLRESISKSDMEVASNLLYLKYKHQAERRNIPFDLEQDYFDKLIFQTCYYCGAEPSNSFNNYRKKNHASHLVVLYNGLDRVNSTLGYTKENVVPCCQVCNYGKRCLDKEQFLQWIKRVYLKQFVVTGRYDE